MWYLWLIAALLPYAISFVLSNLLGNQFDSLSSEFNYTVFGYPYFGDDFRTSYNLLLIPPMRLYYIFFVISVIGYFVFPASLRYISSVFILISLFKIIFVNGNCISQCKQASAKLNQAVAQSCRPIARLFRISSLYYFLNLITHAVCFSLLYRSKM